MKNSVESREEDANVSSSFSRLPDEIILQILNKLTDLKTLCFCYLVAKHFSSIVLQIEAISFTATLLNPRISDKNTVSDVAPSRSLTPKRFYGESFPSVHRFMSKFKRVKSLFMELPSSGHRSIANRFLFKWKVKFGNRIESFIFLSPDSVCAKDGLFLNGNGEEEEDNYELSNDLLRQKVHFAFQCLKDVILRHRMLLYIIKDLPMLEEASITDSGRRGRLSLSGEKLSEVKERLHSALETVLDRVEIPGDIMSECYIPVLKLPVSGYVMKGVFVMVMEMKDLQGGNDFLMNSESGFEDKEEAALYTEAVKEILEKHRGMMHTIPSL